VVEVDAVGVFEVGFDAEAAVVLALADGDEQVTLEARQVAE
jgi:hypothetical protein